MRSASALGVRVLARLLLPLVFLGLSLGPVAAGDEDEYADEAALACSFLPTGLPSVFPHDDTGGCEAYDKQVPDVQDAWWISITWFGNVSGEQPAGPVQELGQADGLGTTSAYGEVAVEGDTDDHGFNTGGDPVHRVIRFARGQYMVTVWGRPADAATGQGYATVIDQKILASMAPGCRLEGTVKDFYGAAVPDIKVRAHLGSDQRDASTDSSGHYAFPGAISTSKVSIELIPEGMDELGSSTRFQVYYRQVLGSLRTDEFEMKDGADCRRDFDLLSIPDTYTAANPDAVDWPDVIEMYQQIWKSWKLADDLGVVLDYGLPLRVFVSCDPAGPLPEASECPAPPTEDAFYIGSHLGKELVTVPNPYIMLTPGDSQLRNLHANRVGYHEFGHAFVTDVFGNLWLATPGRSGPVVEGIPRPAPHGGYYRNYDSGDSLFEALADFYRIMVLKYEDGRQLLSWDTENLELDQQAWELLGAEEEWAVTGALLDFEDGPADYPIAKPVSMTVQKVVQSTDSVLVVATAPIASVPEETPVIARFVDASGKVIARASALARRDASTGEAKAVLDLPDLRPNTLEVVANVGAAGGAPCRVTGPGGCDDDPINVTLEELWTAIADRRTNNPQYPYVSTIEDLYLALGVAFGGDRDANGVDDVAQVFAAHGLFGDTNGNRTYDPGEDIGLTSHPAYKAGNTTYPAMLPRHNSVTPPQKLVAIDTGGIPSEVLVGVTFPGELNDTIGYGSVASVEGDGTVRIDPPPAGMGAVLSLIAVADGHEPALLGRVNADTFWKDAEAHPDASFLSFSATLQKASGTGGPDEPFQLPFELPLGSIVAGGVALLVLVLLVVMLRRRGRRAGS